MFMTFRSSAVTKKSHAKNAPQEEVIQHTVKLPLPLENRVRRCMKLDGIESFADYTRSALTRKCVETERFHGEKSPETA